MRPEQPPHPHDEAADAVRDGRPVDAQFVRGGRPGFRVLRILVISLGIAAVLIIGMWLVSNGGFARQNDTLPEAAAESQSFSSTPTPTPNGVSASVPASAPAP